jgi:hypothetical protein
VGSVVIDLLSVRFFLLSADTRQKKWEYNWTVHQLFMDLKTAYDSVKRQYLYNILLEFGIPTNLVRLNKMFI